MDEFLKSEIIKIEIDKWDEGIRRCSDPGEDYVMQWVHDNAKWFRETWDASCCKRCKNNLHCGYTLKKQCEHFDPR